jgi:hypothetical protein
LFDCGLAPACTVSQHIYPEGDTQCAAEALLAAQPTYVLARNEPGPDISGTHMFIVAWGDGTALLQTRDFSCDGCSDDDPSEYEWTDASVQQLCTVILADGLAEACGCEEGKCPGCQWDPWPGDCGEGCTPGELADCVPIDTPYDCEAIEQALGAG